MRELILHGGKGSRLRPLSLEIPKGFIPVRNISNIERILRRSDGIDGDKTITIPVGDRLIPKLIEVKNMPLRFRETDPAPMLSTVRYLEEDDEPVLVQWGDTLMSADISSMMKRHQLTQAQATMALWKTTDLRELKHWGSVTLDNEGYTKNHPVPDISPEGLIKAGLFIFNPKIAKKMRRIAPESWDMSEIINRLLFAGQFAGYVFQGYRVNLNYGFDLIKASKVIGGWEGGILRTVDSSVSFNGRVELGENVSIGKSVTVQEGVHISNSIILDGAVIGRNTTIVDSVIGPLSMVAVDSFLKRKMVSNGEITELTESPY